MQSQPCILGSGPIWEALAARVSGWILRPPHCSSVCCAVLEAFSIWSKRKGSCPLSVHLSIINGLIQGTPSAS